jgi:hypothetical protein
MAIDRQRMGSTDSGWRSTDADAIDRSADAIDRSAINRSADAG